MTEKTMQYFNTIKEACIKYDEAKQVRMQEKDAMIIADNWDGVMAWNEREKQFPFPFSRGVTTAFRAWTYSVMNQSDILEVPDLPWDEDIPDFVRTLREAGVSEIAITDHSTALMDGLHALAGENLQIVSPCIVKRINGHRVSTIRGILLRFY